MSQYITIGLLISVWLLDIYYKYKVKKEIDKKVIKQEIEIEEQAGKVRDWIHEYSVLRKHVKDIELGAFTKAESVEFNDLIASNRELNQKCYTLDWKVKMLQSQLNTAENTQDELQEWIDEIAKENIELQNQLKDVTSKWIRAEKEVEELKSSSKGD